MDWLDFHCEFENLRKKAEDTALSGTIEELKRISLEAVSLSKKACESNLINKYDHEDNIDILARRVLNALVTE